jgi:hypothetical protein
MYRVVSSDGKREPVDLFATRQEAEAFIAEVDADEPELAAFLSVEAIEVPDLSAGRAR